MTATARITAQTAAGTYEFSILDGASRTFAAAKLSNGENIILQWKDSSGAFHTFKGRDEQSRFEKKEINMYNNVAKVSGPFDGRWVKPITTNSVELTELS